ncbi:glycosyltransferase family 2 protein [Bombilactobacillus bombi]|uniref:Glycosyltransferase family 2 protein n=2 Tax=Bombilactobacillus bombi TaxID=1303590 RepID=A0A417ZD35_9LACO|nr:glycosyltransferase family 2 protein [Bombilactobacillus bombi]
MVTYSNFRKLSFLIIILGDYMLLLSIVMPLYNEERLLSRCLESIEKQINPNFEVIMVNDASTDNTVAVAQSFIKNNPNFRLVNQPKNQGISAARNRGIKEARGQLITFLDGDDWLEPQYTDYFLQSFKNYSIDMAVCGYFKESQHGTIKVWGKHVQGSINRTEIIRHITKISGQVMGYTWNKVYRLALIKQNNLKFESDLSLMEDQVFNVQYATVAQNFYVQPQPLYHYWQHVRSATHTYDLENAKSIGLANYRIVKTLLDVKTNTSEKEEQAND